MRLVILTAVARQAFARDSQGGSVGYDFATHRPHPSSGCGQKSPYSVGRSVTVAASYEGHPVRFLLRLPQDYNGVKPLPLVHDHGGWSDSAENAARESGLQLYVDALQLILVTPEGSDDNEHLKGMYSWNCIGSSQSPGVAGATCTPAGGTAEYCYASCGDCSSWPQCDWTTCLNQVTPTGTGKSHVDGWLPALYDTLETLLCVDTTREFATGFSNGGMMAYQLGVALSSRLAAIAVGGASFHNGFNLSPSEVLHVSP